MNTGFKLHLLVGVLLLLLILLPSIHWGWLSFSILPFLAVAFLAGSVLPDIDQDNSMVRRTLAGGVFVITLFTFSSVFQTNWQTFQAQQYGDFIAVGLAILLPFVAVFALNKMMPAHRGIMHSPFAAGLYGFALFLILILANLGLMNALFIGGFGFLGWLTHRTVDFLGDHA